MRADLTKKLVEDFPRLYNQYHWDRTQSCMSFGFPSHDGWFDLIYRMSQRLEDEFQRLPEEIQAHAQENQIYAAEQVKNKFGMLRVYMNQPSDEMRRIISEAEAESRVTCMECGEKGEYSGMRVMCEEHK